MKTAPRFIAALELLLVFPAVLFMTSLFARSIQPVEYEPAHTAARIVDWYASSTRVGLWVCLMALPFAVLVIGSVALIRRWRGDEEMRDATLKMLALVRSRASILLVAAATCAAGCILAIVAVHVLTD